jgi:CubicO group peptidase (beta-lactamase class C family)
VSLLSNLERTVRSHGIALHTVDVIIDDEPIISGRNAPLGGDIPQRMYSISKSITGLAIGMLAGEGRLSTDDLVVDHFPEFAPVHPWLAETTIRDILSMQGPHRATTFKNTDQDWSNRWLESYFRVPPTHRPGTVFNYDTSGSYVLAALVERLAGCSMIDYLRPRLFDPLRIGDVRFLTSPEGTSHGGSGLICTPHDLLKIAQLVLNNGRLGSHQLIPADYLRRRPADRATPPCSPGVRRCRPATAINSGFHHAVAG